MRMLSKRKDAAFDLLRLAANSPRFDQEPVHRIRANILASIIANERDPHAIAELAWRRRIYGTHPYSRPDEGHQGEPRRHNAGRSRRPPQGRFRP
ncbi:hypothetical protein [Mesorhizobium sp. M1409]|uniref:hypothetical protein n=1 Tax=unclassified Mesorhizobium TaxID=325217 RepID=UPI00333D1737